MIGKKACVLQRWDGFRDGLQNSCLCVGNQGSIVLKRLTANGPAIKGVSVAERVKAGAVSPNRGRVPVPEIGRASCRERV